MTAHSELHCTHYLPLIYSNAMHIDARARLLAAIKPRSPKVPTPMLDYNQRLNNILTPTRQFIIFHNFDRRAFVTNHLELFFNY